MRKFDIFLNLIYNISEIVGTILAIFILYSILLFAYICACPFLLISRGRK